MTTAPIKPTWRCEGCGKLGDDAHIAVYSRDVSAAFDLPAGAAVVRNVCYCAHSPICRARAVAIVDEFEAARRARS